MTLVQDHYDIKRNAEYEFWLENGDHMISWEEGKFDDRPTHKTEDENFIFLVWCPGHFRLVIDYENMFDSGEIELDRAAWMLQ